MAADGPPFKVLIAGAGVAGLEGVLALRELAGARVSIQLLAPEPEFVYRPLRVREPFAYGGAERYPVAELIDGLGVELLDERFSWIDTAASVVHTDNGLELGYDALLLALGAHIHTRFPHAYTIDDRHLDDILHGLLQDVEGGYVKQVAFVVPARMAWQLPIYEIALMALRRAGELGVQLQATIVTPEESPLAIFGVNATQAVSALLDEAGIEVIASGYAEVPSWDTVTIHPSDQQLKVDRVVALPELYGPAVRGLPAAEHGFIPVDVHCKVRGADRVYAAGDAVDFAIKHGGVSAQQADAAAEAIAALAGVDCRPKPFDPTIYGMLLTGGAPKYLRARLSGGHGFSSEVSDQPLWSPPRKIVAKYLGPHLERFESR
ncbi:MAG: hypothetical protein ACRDK4_12960 [Solirubrobacteraceae bacterium]